MHGEPPFTLHAMGQNYQFLLACCPVIKVNETSNRLFQKITMLPSETTKIIFLQTRATIGRKLLGDSGSNLSGTLKDAFKVRIKSLDQIKQVYDSNRFGYKYSCKKILNLPQVRCLPHLLGYLALPREKKIIALWSEILAGVSKARLP